MARLKSRPVLIVVVLAVALAGVLVAILVTRDNGDSNTSAGTSITGTNGTTTTAADPAVMDLQRLMKRLGYYTGPVDGVYGPSTTDAVKAMQEALGVNADGVYGPATDAALKGKAKEVVESIQTELTTYGYYTGPIDGDYGPATKSAVEKLQTDLGITADGLVGAETIDAFHKAVADGTLKPVTTTTTTDTTTTTTDTTTTTPPTTT